MRVLPSLPSLVLAGAFLLVSAPTTRAAEPLTLSVLGVSAEGGEVSIGVVGALDRELRSAAATVPGYASGEEVVIPRPELVGTVGCTTASVKCLTEVARSVLMAQRLLVTDVRASVAGTSLRVRLLDSDLGAYVRMVELRGTPDKIQKRIKKAVKWLLRIPRPPLLEVVSTPAGADVTVDGIHVGKTPIVVRSGMPPGKRVVKITKPGYVDFQQNVLFKIDRTARVEATLTK